MPFHTNIILLLLFATATTISSFSGPVDRKFLEIIPLKASVLTKSWQGLLKDVDQKVGIVPELGGTSVGVKRFGPELERRTLCARQFERCFESTLALAAADKSDDAAAARKTIPSLLIDGQARGPGCTAYACLTAPATIALIEQREDEWSILTLIVNPEERDMDVIAAAELAMLTKIHNLCQESNSKLRIHVKAKETLAGKCKQLGLTPIPNDGEDEEPVWFRFSL